MNLRLIILAAECVVGLGCTTTPYLSHLDERPLLPPTPGAPADTASLSNELNGSDRVRIDDIADYFACDIDRTLKKLPENLGKKWQVKVNFTVELDNQIDATPSVTWQNPLHSMLSFSTVASGDLGFQQQRLFTATYNIVSDTLRAKVEQDKNLCQMQSQGRRPYTLTSDLQMGRAILDGVDNSERNLKLYGALDDDASTAASFQLYAKFLITKQLSAFGPTWNLKYFKGPSGSSGLVNGKYVNTDSVTFVFTKIVPPKKGADPNAPLLAALNLIDQDIKALEARKQSYAANRAIAARRELDLEAQIRSAQRGTRFLNFTLPKLQNDKAAARAEALSANAAAADTEKRIIALHSEQREIQQRQSELLSQARGDDVSAHVSASNAASTQLLTTILQNQLNIH